MAGDPEAVRALWETHRRWVAAVILAHKPRDAELEDLLQEVAVRYVRTIHELRDPASLRGWLRAVAVNVARTAGRRSSTRLRLTKGGAAGMSAGVGATEDVSVEVAAAEEGRSALEAAQRLRPEYREPLLLRCVRGMTYHQIAHAMGLPITTVETRLARARRMLIEEMERHRTGAAND
ncbi:MAG: sigma-70 family RNA polymerase sigma factor [Phycisphaerales bacterium]|nr:MAG: sigma-70 family RNA polymerase sigma factor [Phycisphaerales bacterium]